MKFRRDAPVTLISVSVVVLLLTAIISNRLFSGLTAAVEQSEFDSMEAILAYNLESAGKKALARAEMVADLPSSGRLVGARDRAGLTSEYTTMFDVQRDKHGVDQMQFHTAPATSLLRLHAPGTYDDDLSAFRPMVVSTNQDHVARVGMEIAFNGPALFGVAPVRDTSGNSVGTFEVGISFGPLVDNLKVAYGLEFALFIEEELLDKNGVPPEVFGDQNRLAKYVKYHSTHWDLLQQLVSAADLARLEEPVRFTKDAFDVPYGVVLVPLRGSTGAPLGVMAIAKDFGASRAAAGRSVVWQALLALFGIVTLAGAVQVVVRGFLLRPLAVLTDGLAKIGNEPPSGTPPVEVATLCDELRGLAAEHQRLEALAGSDDEVAE